MKTAPALLLLLLSACVKPLTFAPYRPDTAEFTVDAPVGWRVDERGSFSTKPIAETQWTGVVVDKSEGLEVGAVLSIRRISRLKKDVLKADYPRYKIGVLDMGDRILAGKGGVKVEKTPSGLFVYRRQWDQELGGSGHGTLRKVPMRTETHVLRTKEHDWILEYRAVAQLYDKHHPAYQRLVSTFKLAK